MNSTNRVRDRRARTGSAVATAHTDTAPAVELVGLHRSFGEQRAVDGLDLVIPSGRTVAVLGPNGAGKTTTIDLLLGLGHPDAGTVRLFGLPPRRAVELGLVGVVQQAGGLLPDQTVGETLAYIAATFGRSDDVTDALDRAGLTPIRHRRVRSCSGGEQQRLRIALALVPDPRLLVLDEPTAGLDVRSRLDFWRALRDGLGPDRTVLFATHLLDEAASFADRIVVLSHGRIIADGTADELTGSLHEHRVRVHLPHADADLLRTLDGVERVAVDGDTVTIDCSTPDDTARFLLSLPGARDLRITDPGLEAAFLTLTAEPDTAPPARPAATRRSATSLRTKETGR